ncbi:MAG: hypothetical protein ACYSTW_12825, partial [Planctomycetota bacterium]
QLWDGEYLYSDFDDQGNYTKEAQYGSGTIDLTIDNTLPTGAVTLENASMDTTGETLNVAGGSGDFTDADGDYFDIISIVKATDDNNKIYGGTLDYEGDKTPYESGDTYYYIADPTLPGYATLGRRISLFRL